MKATATRPALLTLNVPQWYDDSTFMAWLNSTECVMTWHKRGHAPTEYSDTMVFVDPSLSGEGSECGQMPDVFWDAIVAQCKAHFSPCGGDHIMVRLTCLAEDAA